jgi:hypothetical protein
MPLCFRNSRVSSGCIAVASLGATLAILASACYAIGRRIPPDLRLLDPRRRPTIDEAFAAYPIAYALNSDERNDVVFFGDSTCRVGIDPLEFQRITGLKAFNLGSSGKLGGNGMAVTVMAYLTLHPKPRAIVMCVSPFCFERDAGTIGGAFPARFAANYGPEVSGVVSELDGISYFARRGAVSICEEGQNVLDVPLDGYERDTFHSLQAKMLASRGYMELPGARRPRPSTERPGPETIVKPDWDGWVQFLADSCAPTRLLIQFTPISREDADARDWTQLETWAREISSRHANVSVYRPIITLYDLDAMWDNMHMNRKGTEAFMPIVAKDVQEALRKEPRGR